MGCAAGKSVETKADPTPLQLPPKEEPELANKPSLTLMNEDTIDNERTEEMDEIEKTEEEQSEDNETSLKEESKYFGCLAHAKIDVWKSANKNS